MLGEDWTSLIGIVCLIIGLAIVAVIVSKKSQTSTLITSFSTALDALLSRSTGSPT
jgi:PRD1 phage membrane DNA delivery